MCNIGHSSIRWNTLIVILILFQLSYSIQYFAFTIIVVTFHYNFSIETKNSKPGAALTIIRIKNQVEAVYRTALYFPTCLSIIPIGGCNRKNIGSDLTVKYMVAEQQWKEFRSDQYVFKILNISSIHHKISF